MIRTRRTRMVCTLGPASRTPDKIEALARAGADVFRLNFSHGSHDDHAQTYEAVRAAETRVDASKSGLPGTNEPHATRQTYDGSRATGAGSTC